MARSGTALTAFLSEIRVGSLTESRISKLTVEHVLLALPIFPLPSIWYEYQSIKNLSIQNNDIFNSLWDYNFIFYTEWFNAKYLHQIILNQEILNPEIQESTSGSLDCFEIKLPPFCLMRRLSIRQHLYIPAAPIIFKGPSNTFDKNRNFALSSRELKSW